MLRKSSPPGKPLPILIILWYRQILDHQASRTREMRRWRIWLKSPIKVVPGLSNATFTQQCNNGYRYCLIVPNSSLIVPHCPYWQGVLFHGETFFFVRIFVVVGLWWYVKKPSAPIMSSNPADITKISFFCVAYSFCGGGSFPVRSEFCKSS